MPGFKINDTIIVSKPPYRDNISDLENMKSISGNVDLIFCCDMLNMGYHVDDVSGIVMMRSTLSDIIYLQKIGRSSSANSNIKPIISTNLRTNFSYKLQPDMRCQPSVSGFLLF